jgi:hypothetical protein
MDSQKKDTQQNQIYPSREQDLHQYYSHLLQEQKKDLDQYYLNLLQEREQDLHQYYSHLLKQKEEKIIALIDDYNQLVVDLEGNYLYLNDLEEEGRIINSLIEENENQLKKLQKEYNIQQNLLKHREEEYMELKKQNNELYKELYNIEVKLKIENDNFIKKENLLKFSKTQIEENYKIIRDYKLQLK